MRKKDTETLTELMRIIKSIIDKTIKNRKQLESYSQNILLFWQKYFKAAWQSF